MDPQASSAIGAAREPSEAEERGEEQLVPKRHERRRGTSNSICTNQSTTSSWTSAGRVDYSNASRWFPFARRAISSWKFDTFIGVCICCNAVTIGVETTYSSQGSAIPVWVEIVELIFLLVYTVELSLRVYVHKLQAFTSRWIRFDAFLVSCGIVELIVRIALSDAAPDALANIMLVRMLRLVRLARAARLMVQFKVLWLLVQGLLSSVLTILWTFVIIFVLIYVFAILGMELVRPDEDAGAAYQEAAMRFNEGLGYTMLVLVEFLTLDSIGSIYIPIIVAKPFLAVYFVAYILIVSVAMMNFVTALMVDAAMAQSAQDKEAEKAWEAAKKKRAIPQLKALFEDLDADGSGSLELEEIVNAPDELKDQLQHIADMSDVKELFSVLDADRIGAVDVEAFCDGILQVTQERKPFEILRISRQCETLMRSSQEALQLLRKLDCDSLAPDPATTRSVSRGSTGSTATQAAAEGREPTASASPPGLHHSALTVSSSARQRPRDAEVRGGVGIEERISGIEATLKERICSLEQRFEGFEESLRRIADAVGA